MSVLLITSRNTHSYARMIVAAYPHEEYDRHPMDVPFGETIETTTVLYDKHNKALKEMIDIVMNEISLHKR